MTSHENRQSAVASSHSSASRYPLLRSFSIASLATMLATATILVLVYRQDQLAEHERISAQRNEQAVRQLIHLLGDRINALAVASEGLDTQALRSNPNLALFPSAPGMALDYDILKLKIYNRLGATIYSSAMDEIGKAGEHPDLLAKALAGEATHRLEFHDRFLGANGGMRDVYVAKTYMPIAYAGERIGAIEIYRDSTPIFEHLKTNAERIPLIVFGGFALLYAALFFHVRRADRGIAEWQNASLESGKRLRLLEQQKLVQTSLDGFLVVRATDGRIIEANDAFCGMVGYTRTELLAMRLADLEAGESPAEAAAHIKKIMAVGYDRFETHHRHKQGYLINLEISVSHSELDGGVNFVFARDISERKRAEAVLVQREREFRTLAESMPDNIVRYNREGVTVYVNPALERTLGDSAAAMIGTTPREYQPDGSYEDYAQLLDTVLASGKAGELEKVLTGPGGETNVHQIRMVPERGENGEVVGVLAIGRDITGRKRMEETLASRERELRALAESSPGMMGSLHLRPDGSVCMPYVSPNIREIFGLEPQNVATDATPLMALIHPHDARMVRESIAESARTLTPWHVEYRILHPSKGERWMEGNTNPELHPDGGVIWYGHVHDITERKNAERQLRKLLAHVQTVREEEKAHLSREIHDELGSILSALKIEIHMLDSGLSAEQKRMPQFARVESMIELFDDVLRATRRIITDLRPSVLDDLGLMAAIKWQAEQFHKHTGIACRAKCVHEAGNGCLNCKDCEHTRDKTLSINLFRIFQESLTNVARHSGASRVEVELQPSAREIVLSISDDGCGLPEGHVIAATSNGMRGMRERVEQLSGRIEFGKPPGGGLYVMVRLPQPAAH